MSDLPNQLCMFCGELIKKCKCHIDFNTLREDNGRTPTKRLSDRITDMEMKLWLLKRVLSLGNVWDCNNGFVIRAKTEQGARRMASLKHGCEGKDAWFNTIQTTCEEINVSGESEILLEDFCRG